MTDRRDLDGSSSICIDRQFSPISYHWFRTDADRRLIDEVNAAIDPLGLDQADRERLIGEFAARMGRLERGLLIPRKHIKGPMESATNLEVFEVRAGIEVRENEAAELRAYHVEPRQLARVGGSTIVGLHVHAKDVNPSININAAQDREIQKAVDRYFSGRSSWWGLS